MQIKRLRLTGFKSFVDPADLRIEPGLTGVVGPNGCGKSNLLEALRWTMGENSPKSMRGAGMEDVIFAGTATRPARDFAEVLIHTEDGDGEHEIVRRIERGAGSAYRIDGRDVRAKDVQLLFADAATGAHSPALVSQNRIGAVIAAKPADRRAMLEEAAGIAGLHVRRRDAEQKLRATEANLEKLDQLIGETEARAAALRRQARQAERYRTLSQQIRVAEARMIFARWREAAQAADAAKAEATAAEARVRAAFEAQEAASAKQQHAAAGLAHARLDAQQARDAASEAGHRLAALRDERARAERRLAELTDQAARLAADREREGALASDAAAAIAQAGEEAKRLEVAIAAAEAALPLLDQALAEAASTAGAAETALAQALAQQASEAAEARVAAAALAQASARVERAARDRAAATASLEAIGAEEPVRAERDTATKHAEQAIAAAEAARARIATAEATEADARTRRDAAQAERAAAAADLAALDAEANTLTRALQRSGTDRLLDHVRAAPGYERALAAALGDDLEIGLDAAAEAYWTDPRDSVRAELVEAQSFSSRQEKGSASTVNRLEQPPAVPSRSGGSATGSPVRTESGSMLSEHVTAPTLLAPRLTHTIVADADDGRPLAPGERLVTRDGYLRRWDGLIARSNGAAAAERLERQNRLAAIEAALPPAHDTLAAATAALAAIDGAIADAAAAARDARTAADTADAARRDAEARAARAATQLERLAGQRTDAAARLARIDAEHAEAATERGRAAAALAALPDTAATGTRVATLQREADTRRTAAAEARAARATGERDLGAARERLAAATADAKSWRARAGDAARRIADMAKREAAIAEERDALAPRPAALADDITAAERTLTDARTAADTSAAAERSAEAELRATEHAARTTTEALATAREARAGATARAENHELRRVEMGRIAGERFECPAPVLPERIGFDSATVASPQDESAAHERLSVERERLGPVNLVAERELAELEASATGNAAEREELGQAVNRLRGSIGTLNREGRQRLLAAFEAVNGHFRRLFTTLFNGGQAHLELIDSDDPLEAGLEIMAQPPGKRLQSLTLLSGGEQALTAVALIFGLFLTNPAPICVLDEVDAPLDDANIERFCDLLDRMTRETETRYLIVTHNAVTMSRMHRLFGVTMVERGVSRLVSVDLQAAETLLAAE